MCSPRLTISVGVDVVADGELARRDDAFGLETDVEKDLVLVDLHHRALDDVTVVELDDGGVDGLFERGAAEVVLDDGAGDVGPGLVEGAHRGIGQQGDGAGNLTGRCGGGARRVS